MCPHTISRPPMKMQWQELSMRHWRYPVDEVQALLPDDLTVDTFEGEAWVGLVSFRRRVDLPFLPTMAEMSIRRSRAEDGAERYRYEATRRWALPTGRRTGRASLRRGPSARRRRIR